MGSKIKKLNISLLGFHIAFWCMLLLPAFLFKYNSPTDSVSASFIYRMLINNILLIVIFYLNAYYFFPIVFKKRNWLVYALVVLVTLGIAFLISRYVSTEIFPSKRRWKKSVIPDLFSYTFILGISCSYRIIVDYFKTQKINKERENERLKTELSFLRSQVSPHFMFNVLNNLVALARKKSDQMEPALLQLSALLRYMLYEGDRGRITVTDEVAYVQGYVDLQKLRFGDEVEVVFSVEGDTDSFSLEPMILIPFVENAFKHGMGTLDNPRIEIRLWVSPRELIFSVSNDVAPQNESRDDNSGIGLANTKRRLELLYGNDYKLAITNDGKKFNIQLKISKND